jgi:hypothetical protein
MADSHAGRKWDPRTDRIAGERDRPGARPYTDGPQAEADALIEKLTYLMDRSIPIGGGYSIGIDRSIR